MQYGYHDNMERVMTLEYPILYSFRRCPYAMRARLALLYAGIAVELREIDLKNKHQQFLKHSHKGTVPVLMLNSGAMIDESIDIVEYAFSVCDKNDLSYDRAQEAVVKQDLLHQLNSGFISAVTTFKYHERYTNDERELAKEAINQFLAMLEQKLQSSRFIIADCWSQPDIITFPFVRQLYRSDADYFDGLPYPNVKRWMFEIIDSPLFAIAMYKNKVWDCADEPVIMRVT